MSLKTKLLVLGSILGFVAAAQKNKETAPFEVEGTKKTSVFQRVSGHRYHKTYPVLNRKNAVRKGMHQQLIKEYAERGIHWTPYGLYHMNHV